MQASRNGRRMRKCSYCDKLFKRSRGLRKHERSHTGDIQRPYKCSLCDKAFYRKETLNSHTRSHTGEKPYKCSLCDKAYTSATGLAHHRTTHTGEKPYTCSVCNKAFAMKSYLKIHKRTHTGEKPYTCQYCDKTFSHSSAVSVHMKIHLRKTFIGSNKSRNVCGKSFRDQSSRQTFENGGIEMSSQGSEVSIKSGPINLQRNQITQGQPDTCSGGDKTFAYSRTSVVVNGEENVLNGKESGESFSNSHHLTKHLDYTCFVCEQAFVALSDLRVHMAVHTVWADS